ncbi:MAG: hypothetical protein FJ313_00450 [Gemmatimonadetes bacterium]|nr:hypothetical protein [Gemmatimonadota bacterium]
MFDPNVTGLTAETPAGGTAGRGIPHPSSTEEGLCSASVQGLDGALLPDAAQALALSELPPAAAGAGADAPGFFTRLSEELARAKTRMKIGDRRGGPAGDPASDFTHVQTVFE